MNEYQEHNKNLQEKMNNSVGLDDFQKRLGFKCEICGSEVSPATHRYFNGIGLRCFFCQKTNK